MNKNESDTIKKLQRRVNIQYWLLNNIKIYGFKMILANSAIDAVNNLKIFLKQMKNKYGN